MNENPANQQNSAKDNSKPTDLVEEASQESFPASDPPSWAGGEKDSDKEPPLLRDEIGE